MKPSKNRQTIFNWSAQTDKKSTALADRVRAMRAADPDSEAAIAAFVRNEVAMTGNDPAEGRIVRASSRIKRETKASDGSVRKKTK
jgi:hypothetical protein